MKTEIKFITKEYNYYNRAVGIIKCNDKFLVVKVNNASYYHIPGGHIEIGEDSPTALAREIKEELNYTVKDSKLFCIQENFYKKNNLSFHGVEYYYLVTVLENIDTINRKFIEIDRGEEKHLSIEWFDKFELDKIDLRPKSVKDLIINNKLDDFVHLIKRDKKI